MFASHFQGGPAVEVFTTKGKNPLEKWKVFGGSKNASRVYDKTSKGYIYEVSGTQTKIQLPADDRKHTLRLQQPYLAFQVRVPVGKSFGVELGFHDAFGTRRRILLSTAFKEIKQTPLHVRVPLPVVVRNSWLNICLDLPDLVALNFEGQAFHSLDFISISAWCSIRKVFTLRHPPADPSDPASPGEPIPATLDLEGSSVQLVRMSMLEGAAFQSGAPNRPRSAAVHKPVRAVPRMGRPTSAPANNHQVDKRKPAAKPAQHRALGRPRVDRLKVNVERCDDDAGDMCSPQTSFAAATAQTEDQFARLSLQERRRHLDAVCASFDADQEDEEASIGSPAQPSPAQLRPVRSARQVWASSPAAEQLVWTDPDKADYSSRYDDESDADEDNTVLNPWGVASETVPAPAAAASSAWPLAAAVGEQSFQSFEGSGPVHARESVLLADAMQIYGQESRYESSAVASPSPSQIYSRNLNELDGDDSEEEDLWLSHSPRSPQGLEPRQPSAAQAASPSAGAPGWLARPPAVCTSMDSPLGGTLFRPTGSPSPLGGTLFRPTDSPSPSSLSQDDFGATVESPRQQYEPSAYSAEKVVPDAQQTSAVDEGWSSPDVYDTCLADNPTADLEEDDDELDLLYDPALNCYFDPRTNQYYELKD